MKLINLKWRLNMWRKSFNIIEIVLLLVAVILQFDPFGMGQVLVLKSTVTLLCVILILKRFLALDIKISIVK